MTLLRRIVLQLKLVSQYHHHPNPSLCRGKDHVLSGVYVGIAATCPWRWRRCAVGKKTVMQKNQDSKNCVI